MVRSSSDGNGVSPILAILLLIAITLMIAGIVTIFVFSLVNDDHESGKFYIFNVEMDSSRDEVILRLMDGDPFNVTLTKLLVDDQEVPLGNGTFEVGSERTCSCGFNIIQGQEYTIKLVMDNKVVLYQEKTAF